MTRSVQSANQSADQSGLMAEADFHGGAPSPRPMSDVAHVVEYLDAAVQSYVDHPADTDYHDGYLSALEEVRRRVSGKPGRRVRRHIGAGAD